VRVRVVRLLAQHLGEGGLGVGEAAQAEQADPALVQRRGVLRGELQRRIDPREGRVRLAEVVQRLGLEQREPGAQLAVEPAPAGRAPAAAPRVLQAEQDGRALLGLGDVDVEVGGRRQRLRIIRIARQRHGERDLRLAVAAERGQRRRAVVVGLDRLRHQVDRELGAPERGLEVAGVVEQAAGLVEHRIRILPADRADRRRLVDVGRLPPGRRRGRKADAGARAGRAGVPAGAGALAARSARAERSARDQHSARAGRAGVPAGAGALAARSARAERSARDQRGQPGDRGQPAHQ